MEKNDNPTKGPYDYSKFEHGFGYKVAVLEVMITDTMCGSGRAVNIESGFGYVASAVQLKNKVLFSITYIKKNAHLSNHMEA